MAKLTVFRSAILNAGYRVSLSHANKGAIKTNAPPEFIWDLVRAYEKENPSTKKNWTGVAKAILEQEKNFSDTKIDFTEHEEADPASRKQKLLRFQHNPPNWGPKSKARVFVKKGENEEPVDKRAKNQGKFSSKRRKMDESPLKENQSEKSND